MKALLYAIIAFATAAALAWLLFNSGLEVKGGEVHSCEQSTNLNDLFCKENQK